MGWNKKTSIRFYGAWYLYADDRFERRPQYPNVNISFRHTCGIYHDRYIVLDYNSKTERIYHCGASSKDVGKKVTTISEVSDRQVYHPIVDTLLKNPILMLT